MKRFKKPAMLVLLVGAVASLVWWWHQGQVFPSTDDAYLGTDVVTIGTEITGRVAEVSVAENAYVKAGDVLFVLDNAAVKAALDTAQAQFDLAVQAPGATGSNVAAAEAQVASTAAAVQVAEVAYTRAEALFKLGDASQAALDQATAARDQALAQNRSAEAALAAARDQLGGTGADNAGVRAALGALSLAQLNVERSTVRAPVAGWVTNLSLRPGQVVSAGQPLFALIEDGEWWVDANFKETDLERIRLGQPVTVTLDMYPDEQLQGTVESIAAGSGAAFSLLPPENATGNWVKVTQRFGVRVRLQKPAPEKALTLRVGSSATATVDTTVPVGSTP